MDFMTERTDHPTRAQAAAPRNNGRQVALAASVALLAVTGTATIAWSALSLALGPGLATQAEAAAPAAQQADTSAFAGATRALAATPVVAEDLPAPVVLSTQDRAAPQPASSGAVANPVTTANAEPGDTAPARSVRPVIRPVAAARATPEPAAAPAPRIVSAPAPQPRAAAPETGLRLDRLWSVGLFR